MSNVIDLFEKDLKFCSYFEFDDGELGLSMRDRSIMIRPLNNSDFEFVFGEDAKVFNRKELAEFLYAASVFVDSEGRFAPHVDLVGFNY